MTKSTAEVARLFRAVDAAAGTNHAELVFPGYAGLVVAQGEVRTMSWGFPLKQISKKTGKPIKPKAVTNTRDDRLHTGFWQDSFVHRRCLIPVSAFAEAEGEQGRMTRTWLSVPGADLFAIAGIWRPSDEWGPVYSMVTTRPTTQTAAIHDRMPVVLQEADQVRWVEGSPDEARTLCQPYAEKLTIERTGVSWIAR